ncbi:tail fiber domain-containing protein [Methylocucumis oryzae]|uniref:tail fiber domain-containing protein n=1 Tax=Methylocucumis oryzae TaxID=1632867 RepID=UPI0006965FAD|nr:tail fiber domain-containing protein [Methylocucumis oryzae]
MLFNGTFNSGGNVPTSGPGTRLMWYPVKAAFRVGRVLGTHWDEANVGSHSIAMGYSTTASADYSTAIGFVTTASGAVATSMGRGTSASGNYSTAIGYNTGASGEFSTAMGFLTDASGYSSTTMGNTTTAGGSYATAMGAETIASGDYSTAMGYSSDATGNYATAMGAGTAASGFVSTAMGDSTVASGIRSTAMGRSTTASGDYSTAMGTRTTAQAYASVALGQYNAVAGSTTTWVATDPLLVVGNGSDASHLSNALTLLKNGNMTIAGTLTQNSDSRLKTNIHDLNQPLQKITHLHGIQYQWNPATHPGTVDADGIQLGFLAQDVQTVLPELVKPDSNGYLSVNYVGVIPVLVEAVKDLRKKLEKKRPRIGR